VAHFPRPRADARRLFLAAAVLLLVTAAAAPAVQAQAVDAGALLAEAARHDALALKDDRMAARERRLARLASRKAKLALKPAGSRRLRRRARRQAARAKTHRKRAKRHRKAAARLRRRAATPPPVHASVVARRPAIPLGTALDWRSVQSDPGLRDTFLRNFDQVTPENELKMFALQPRQGEYDFDNADAMVDWAGRTGSGFAVTCSSAATSFRSGSPRPPGPGTSCSK
jgi:hypothetical protein